MTIKYKHYIGEESDERSSGDGYWVYLHPGYHLSGDTAGGHAIHEDTKRECYARLNEVEPCDCDECLELIRKHSEYYIDNEKTTEEKFKHLADLNDIIDWSQERIGSKIINKLGSDDFSHWSNKDYE